MVLQKRLDYGFNGYRVPAMPRATRSKLARRDSSRRKIQDNHHYAFDLLATVAGRLLLERESFPTAGKSSLGKDRCEMDTNSLKKEQRDENSPPKGECYEELKPQDHNQSSTLKESTCAHNIAFSGLASVITTPPDCTEQLGSAKNLVTGKNKFEIGNLVKREKVGFSEFGLSGNPKFEHERSTKLELQVLADSGADQYSVEYPAVSNGKSPARVSSSNSSAKVSLCRNHIPCGPFPAAVKLGSSIRDDDENSSGCTHPSTLKKAYKPPSPITDHRVRKLLTLKYRKLPSTTKDGELSNVDGDLKRIYCNNRKAFYKRQKTRRNYPFKKRKFHECRSVSGSDRGTSGEGNHYSSRKGINRDASGHHAKMLGVNGTASSRGGQHTFFKSRDSHVKLRIKSFRVPELFVDIPETATVGSLKRNVMDAVTAILGGGVRIGVVLQGKKVKDDNKTLLQTGISHDNHSDALHFILEPKASQAPISPSPNGHPSLNSCDKSQSSSKYPPTTGGSHQPVFDVCPDLPVTSLGNFIESDHDSAPSPTDTSTENSAADSQALVAIPVTGMEALTVVPAPPKSKQSEIMPRRIRRPFSVSEVEALVQAVETLGTGRWRDVKRRAFDYASHRTYVDLKDKWKTLVHTAKISPGQRRGEPVPQQLLDRVLAAHAYWSHSQQQHKHK